MTDTILYSDLSAYYDLMCADIDYLAQSNTAHRLQHIFGNQGKNLLDLDYSEDSEADVDLNIIKTGSGGFVEIQGTAEREPFTDKQMKAMLALADKGIKQLISVQKQTVGKL